jgi:hypothetical protein
MLGYYYEKICLLSKCHRKISRGYHLTYHRHWRPQLDPTGFLEQIASRPTQVLAKMYEDIPLTIRNDVQLENQNP